MKRWKALLERVKNDRKFRCGGFSLLLTAAVIAVVLLIGALADTLESRYALQADFSFNAATSQGEVTRAVVEQLDKNVQLYAVVPVSGGDETLLSLLKRYDAASDRISVTEENLLRNPALQTAFTDAAGRAP